MDKPWLSSAEAFVIGHCVGEVVDQHYAWVGGGGNFPLTTPPEYTLNGLLKSRLRAYFPELQPHSWLAVDVKQLPEGVFWKPASQEQIPPNDLFRPMSQGEIGVAECQPGTIFLREKGDVRRVDFDVTRHGLLDQLLLLVGDAMWLPPTERFLFALETCPFHMGDWNRVVATFRDASPALQSFVDGGADDEQRISNVLGDIMEFNECSQHYDLGRRFGGVSSKLDEFAASFLIDAEVDAEWTLPGESDYIPYTRAVDELLEALIVRRTGHASNLLQQLRRLVPFKPVHEFQVYCQQIDAHRLLWLAFGEILAVLRDDDLRTTNQDSRVVDRAFVVLRADSPDDIERKVRQAERAMSESPDDTPRDFIVALSPAIEALAKRLWSSDFGGSAQLGVGAVLRQRIRSGSPSEARFANVAQALYYAYRNPAVHNLDAFACSFHEARFFVFGIRTLLELSQEIFASRKS